MIVLPETTKTAAARSVRGENGVSKKPKSRADDRNTESSTMG
jgi:hypothetical protein